MDSFSKTSDEKRGHISVDSQQVDTGAQLDASLQTTLDPNEALRIRWVWYFGRYLTLTILNQGGK